jgi:hypothetical protein
MYIETKRTVSVTMETLQTALRVGAGALRVGAGALRGGAGALRGGAGALRGGAGVLRGGARALRGGAGALRGGAGMMRTNVREKTYHTSIYNIVLVPSCAALARGYHIEVLRTWFAIDLLIIPCKSQAQLGVY